MVGFQVWVEGILIGRLYGRRTQTSYFKLIPELLNPFVCVCAWLDRCVTGAGISLGTPNNSSAVEEVHVLNLINWWRWGRRLVQCGCVLCLSMSEFQCARALGVSGTILYKLHYPFSSSSKGQILK